MFSIFERCLQFFRFFDKILFEYLIPFVGELLELSDLCLYNLQSSHLHSQSRDETRVTLYLTAQMVHFLFHIGVIGCRYSCAGPSRFG